MLFWHTSLRGSAHDPHRRLGQGAQHCSTVVGIGFVRQALQHTEQAKNLTNLNVQFLIESGNLKMTFERGSAILANPEPRSGHCATCTLTAPCRAVAAYMFPRSSAPRRSRSELPKRKCATSSSRSARFRPGHSLPARLP